MSTPPPLLPPIDARTTPTPTAAALEIPSVASAAPAYYLPPPPPPPLTPTPTPTPTPIVEGPLLPKEAATTSEATRLIESMLFAPCHRSYLSTMGGTTFEASGMRLELVPLLLVDATQKQRPVLLLGRLSKNASTIEELLLLVASIESTSMSEPSLRRFQLSPEHMAATLNHLRVLTLPKFNGAADLDRVEDFFPPVLLDLMHAAEGQGCLAPKAAARADWMARLAPHIGFSVLVVGPNATRKGAGVLLMGYLATVAMNASREGDTSFNHNLHHLLGAELSRRMASASAAPAPAKPDVARVGLPKAAPALLVAAKVAKAAKAAKPNPRSKPAAPPPPGSKHAVAKPSAKTSAKPAAVSSRQTPELTPKQATGASPKAASKPAAGPTPKPVPKPVVNPKPLAKPAPAPPPAPPAPEPTAVSIKKRRRSIAEDEESNTESDASDVTDLSNASDDDSRHRKPKQDKKKSKFVNDSASEASLYGSDSDSGSDSEEDDETEGSEESAEEESLASDEEDEGEEERHRKHRRLQKLAPSAPSAATDAATDDDEGTDLTPKIMRNGVDGYKGGRGGSVKRPSIREIDQAASERVLAEVDSLGAAVPVTHADAITDLVAKTRDAWKAYVPAGSAPATHSLIRAQTRLIEEFACIIACRGRGGGGVRGGAPCGGGSSAADVESRLLGLAGARLFSTAIPQLRGLCDEMEAAAKTTTSLLANTHKVALELSSSASSFQLSAKK